LSKGLAHNEQRITIRTVLQKGLNSEPKPTQRQLNCSISIITTIAKGFHICSHQRFGDHCKRKAKQETNTKKKE